MKGMKAFLAASILLVFLTAAVPAGLAAPAESGLPTGCFLTYIPGVLRNAQISPGGSSSGKYSRPMADFNGDGCTDIAIGVPGEASFGIENSGLVYVVYGSTGDWTENPVVQILAQPDPIENDSFGHALAAGDFNRDGFSDLAVGIPAKSLPLFFSGQVRVFYGSPTGFDFFEYDTFDQLNLIDFPEEWDRFGLSLAAGDFNGDGFDDLTVSAPGEAYQGLEESGVIHVVFGSQTGLTTAGNLRFAQNDLNTGDVGASDWFGFKLTAGDFNGDGFDDLVAGGGFEDILGIEDAGAIDILYGSPAGPDPANHFIDQSLLAGGSIEAEDYFGAAIGVGDFDADGYADLAVGSIGESINGEDEAGTAHVMYGSSAGLSFSGTQKWDQGNLPGVEESGDHFGAAFIAADFNGDGYDELAIGVTGENVTNQPGEDSAGAVQVLFGSNAGLTGSDSQIWTQDSAGIPGESSWYDLFGATLTSGDYNRDGYQDIAIGAPFDDYTVGGFVSHSGEVTILYGSAGGLSADGSLRFYESLSIFPGVSSANDYFGQGIR